MGFRGRKRREREWKGERESPQLRKLNFNKQNLIKPILLGKEEVKTKLCMFILGRILEIVIGRGRSK